MTKVSDIAAKVRSKNAGPFWVTIDVFCGNPDTYGRLRNGLTTRRVAERLQIPDTSLKRFDIPSLSVIKFSLPRPVVQGSRFDRDMHGAQWAVLVAELPIDD